jgi:hypothetical protein
MFCQKSRICFAISSLVFSSAAFAAPPVPYGEWSVTNGAVDTSVSCANTGVTCKTVASDNGFIYEEVSTPYYNFLRLILTDANATGVPTNLGFTSETYTPFALATDGIAQGIASKQVVRDAADNFVLDAEVQKGHMRGLNAATADDMYSTKISQSMSNAEMSGVFSFTNYTSFATGQSTTPDTDNERGRKLDISEQVLIGNPGDATKQQTFVQRQRSGDAGNGAPFPFPGAPQVPIQFTVNNSGNYFATAPITTAGSMTLPVTSNGRATTGTNTVAWASGNDIVTTWIAQDSNIAQNTATQSAYALSYQRVANNTSGVNALAVVVDLSVPPPLNPFAWDQTNFGTAPSLQ